MNQEDIYEKLLTINNIERFEIDNEPNMYIVFVMLRNHIINKRKREKFYSSDEFDYSHVEDENTIDEEFGREV